MFRFFAPDPNLPRHENGYLNRWLGPSIGRVVLSAQKRGPVPVFDLRHAAYSYGLRYYQGQVVTHDSARLDTIEFAPSAPSYQRSLTIIHFNGNNGQYQDDVESLMYTADSLQATVIGCNYRGVGLSLGAAVAFDDLITDGIAETRRVLDSGIPSNKILLDGHSLGGAVATMTAAYFHRHQLPVYVWNDRSFALLSSAAAGIIGKLVPNQFQTYSQPLLGTATYSIMPNAGWEAEAAKAYLEIPAEYKGYMVVTKPCTRPGKQSYGDGLIDHDKSLHKGVSIIEKHLGRRTGFKVRSLFENGHNHNRRNLVSKENENITGQDLFEAFARKI